MCLVLAWLDGLAMDAVLTRESPPIIDISDLFVGDYLLFPNQAFILLEITCT